MSVILQPVIHRDAYTGVLERELVAWLREAVFTPLLLALEENAPERDNAPAGDGAVLAAALRSGTVTYINGRFSGAFNAAISRELRARGARFASDGTYRIDPDRLPYDLRGLLADSVARNRETHAAVLLLVAAMLLNLKVSGSVSVGLASVFDSLDRQLWVSLGRVRQQVELPAAFSESERRRLTAVMEQSAEQSIVDFTRDRLLLLRQRVQENQDAGGTVTSLSDLLEAEFGVAQRKAAFIAEQETSLLVSQYRQARYESLGVQEYVWETCLDERVRPDHAALQSRRFAFSSPPIVDRATGRRGNPGEDYNCRCSARPILNLVEA